MKKEEKRQATAIGEYDRVAKEVSGAGDITSCASLPEHFAFWTGGYNQVTSGGPLYPQYGDWAQRTDCVTLAALENSDYKICEDGLAAGLVFNRLWTEECIRIVADKELLKGNKDALKICEYITHRDKKRSCLDSTGIDLTERYKTLHSDW